MGFWKGVQHVVTLGGSYRCDKAREKILIEQSRYNYLRACIDSCNTRITSAIDRLRRKFEVTKTNLEIAQAILFPPCIAEREEARNLRGSTHTYSREERARNAELQVASSHIGTKSALLGVGVGTSTAIAAWGAVQVAGIASTGTFIGGLHGIAASNAGWAAFGGGSLATGGGGMALGHLILPGVGLAIGVAFASTMAHAEANKMNRVYGEICTANVQNKETLMKVEQSSNALEAAEHKFDTEDGRLREAIFHAKRKLFRYGWLSKVWRYLRYRFKGIYYTAAEQPIIVELDAAINRFMASFGATS